MTSILPRLFEPIDLRGLTLKNRIVMPPMGTRYPTYGGAVTPKLTRYYLERARGGVGLIIVQFASISPEGVSSLYPLGIWDDAFVPGLRDLVAQLHAAGAKVAIQLAHAGGTANSTLSRRPAVGPSAVPALGREVPRELTREGIARLVDAFGAAARRAMEAGFDAVELHVAHGYLLNQFLSPLFNRRADEYGGSLEGRARFPLEVLRRTRETVGDGMPILCRLSADDGVEGSLGLAEAQVVATMLEREGADVIDVTAGIGESFEVSAPPMAIPAGSLVPYAAAIKKAVGVPVVAVAKLHDPRMAEEVLAEGKADLIAVGRGLIADPEWPRKAAEGRFGEIRPCLTCNRPECHGRIFQQVELGCVVNAAVGREAQSELRSAAQPRRILIVGGGPAGMEAARVAALRGHRVVLCERTETLGGQLLLAAAPPYKGDMEKLVRYLAGQMARQAVEVRLGCAVTPEMVAALAPDAVIVATGAQPVWPPIPGAKEHAVSAWDVLSGKAQVGDRVALVGGGDVGCETAEFLAARGKQVSILEMLTDVAPELVPWTRRMLLDRLVTRGVEILLQARVTAIEPKRVLYERRGVIAELTPVDSVVLACGSRPQAELAEQLRTARVAVQTIGDAVRAGNLADAIRAGFQSGAAV
ncbi:MAG: FAD-dependent oxidoreductase [Chloroflexi bacterium]|nr:FAD-dependent oxidoreductase [Chloroflexota bacterium]